MTKLLDLAVRRARQLPLGEQDAIGALILDEIENEQRWDKALASSRSALAKLAAEARAEHRARKTKPLDSDKL